MLAHRACCMNTHNRNCADARYFAERIMNRQKDLHGLLLKSRNLVSVAGALLLAGCHGDPYFDSYTRTKPKVSNLTGTYVLTEQTLNDQPVANLRTKAGVTASSHNLVIRSDGTFVATNIPQWSQGVAGDWSIKSFKSGSGKWKLDGADGADGWWGLDFSSSNIKLPNNDGWTDLLGEKPPFKILLNLARDPDQDEAMTFEKQNP